MLKVCITNLKKKKTILMRYLFARRNVYYSSDKYICYIKKNNFHMVVICNNKYKQFL